jgi:hypothetical protein
MADDLLHGIRVNPSPAANGDKATNDKAANDNATDKPAAKEAN